MNLPSVSSIRAAQPLDLLKSTAPSGPADSFAQAMSDAMGSVNDLQQQAHASIDSFMAGENTDIHKIALDQQKASVSFDLFLQVRNKAVSAYQEIMRMQV